MREESEWEVMKVGTADETKPEAEEKDERAGQERDERGGSNFEAKKWWQWSEGVHTLTHTAK